jgi:hypothetical protein
LTGIFGGYKILAFYHNSNPRRRNDEEYQGSCIYDLSFFAVGRIFDRLCAEYLGCDLGRPSKLSGTADDDQ